MKQAFDIEARSTSNFVGPELQRLGEKFCQILLHGGVLQKKLLEHFFIFGVSSDVFGFFIIGRLTLIFR